MTRILVIDTSYMLELYEVPGFFEIEASKRIKEKFAEAINRSDVMIVPLGCIFELCNHVCDVREETTRIKLARRIANDIESSYEIDEFPWRIVPVDGETEFRKHVEAYKSIYSKQAIGLTDTQVAETAKRSKEKYRMSPQYAIHIWTRDTRLKRQEPDYEADQFV